MNEKKLLRALGNVDNQYIKEAEPMKENWPYPGRYMSQGLRNRMRSGGGKLQYEKQEKK